MTSTKALGAYLKSRHKSLTASVHMLGLDQKVLNSDTLSDDIVGRIARLLNITPEALTAGAASFA